MTDAISVRCRCGGVEMEISADPIAQFFCHCDDCQAVHIESRHGCLHPEMAVLGRLLHTRNFSSRH